MPTATESRTFKGSVEDVRAAASDALKSLGADVEVSEDGNTVSGKTGWSLMSFFGERVKVTLAPHDDAVAVTVVSEQSRGQLIDLGRRNQKNVGTIVNAMTTRLGS